MQFTPTQKMNQIKPMQTLAVFGILLVTCRTLCADVALVADGKPVSEIVLSDEATPSVKIAAEELQRHLKSMSGAELPIVSEASPGVANQVYVGESDTTRKLGVSLDDVKDDGFKIVAAKNHVILAGRQKYLFAESFSKFKDVPRKERQKAWEEYCGHKWRFPPIINYNDFNEELGFFLWDATGTLYATYELLGQLGLRWYMPVEEIGMVIPKLKDISIKDQSIKREPEFPVRIMTDSGNGTYKNEFLWYKSLGVGSSFSMPIYHSLSGPTKIKPEEQPREYYGVVNGKVKYTGPKLTSEKLRADTIEYLEWVDKAFPGIPYVSIGQPDGWSGMDDEDAAAGWNKTDRGPKGQYSDYWWDFFLDIRKRYLAKHPGKKFTTFAYGPTMRAPTNLEKVPDDTTVVFCQSSSSVVDEIERLPMREEWISKLKHKNQLLIWDYYIRHAFTYKLPPIPAISTKLLQNNLKGLYDHAAGFIIEVGWNHESEREKVNRVIARPGISHLMLYLYSRLMWDRDLDVQSLLDEYYTLFYGPARSEMKEFFEFSESVWIRPEPREITATGGFLKQEDVDRYFDILQRAKEKAGDTIYGKRIAFIMAEIESLKLLFDKLKRSGPDIQIQTSKNNQPVIDGDLSKPFWQEPAGTFITLRDMSTGKTPRHVTTSVSFRWLDDNSALIVGIECKEPMMDKLSEGCKVPDSSSIYNDDTVEIRLETAGGIRPLIVINSAGAILDECITSNLADLASFYKVDQVAVKKYPDRWTVEVRIDVKPISGERPTKFFPWGVNINRQRMAGNEPEHYMLSPSGTNFKDMKSMANIFVRR